MSVVDNRYLAARDKWAQAVSAYESGGTATNPAFPASVPGSTPMMLGARNAGQAPAQSSSKPGTEQVVSVFPKIPRNVLKPARVAGANKLTPSLPDIESIGKTKTADDIGERPRSLAGRRLGSRTVPAGGDWNWELGKITGKPQLQTKEIQQAQVRQQRQPRRDKACP